MAKHIHIHVHDDEFKEAEHPRAKNGEFTAGAAQGATKAVGKAKTAAQGKASPESPAKPPRAAPAWTMHHGGKPTQEEHARLTKLRVPPAWTGIKLAPDDSHALQVTGKDVKGRSQYLYSAAHSEKAAAEKFARLKAFHGVAGKILTQAQQDMFNDKLPQRQRDAAAGTRLIAETGFRIGSDTDTGADVKAHGASTLTGEHVQVNGNKLTFAFVGKKGVNITKTVEHPELARFIRDAKKRNGDGALFRATDANVRDYFHGAGGDGFKVKDFRTWQGTNEALKALGGMREPTTAKEFQAMRLAVGKQVAAHLGNTPTVALESYIDPTVFARWRHLK